MGNFSFSINQHIICSVAYIWDASEYSVSWKKKCSTLSLNGRHSHMNLSHRVLNVIIRLLFLSSMTCQYPDLAPSKKKSVEPTRSGRISSIVMLYHWSSFMFLVEILCIQAQPQGTIWVLHREN